MGGAREDREGGSGGGLGRPPGVCYRPSDHSWPHKQGALNPKTPSRKTVSLRARSSTFQKREVVNRCDESLRRGEALWLSCYFLRPGFRPVRGFFLVHILDECKWKMAPVVLGFRREGESAKWERHKRRLPTTLAFPRFEVT